MMPAAFFALLLPIMLLRAHAAPAAVTGPEVEVGAVKFSNVRSAKGNWLEADVVLNVRPPPGTPGQMLPRVHVALLLGFELPAVTGGERKLEHYRAEAECVALENGRANVRFYLPPELVKRDQLHGDPKYWGAEVAVSGRAIPAGRGAYSSALPGAEARKNFQSRAGAAATANDGLLLPQYLTPFANEYPRATPSFVRHDAR